MRISTKGRYALMVLIDLAEQGLDKPVSAIRCRTTRYI